MSSASHKHSTAQPAQASHPEPAETAELIHTDALGLERLVFFSDAVFAIAITLLALDIRLPVDNTSLSDAALLNRLLLIWPNLISYVISFMVIGGFWLSHHRAFRIITRYDGRLLFLNLLLMMVIAFAPFPTSVLSTYGNRIATILYALTMVIAGLISAAMWWYACRGHRLVPASLSQAEGRRRLLQSLVVPVIFLLSIGIAFINDDAARYSWLLIALVWPFVR
jgi:uncharacterized membrane protein